MDHFGAAAKAEDRRDLGRGPSPDPLRVAGVVCAQAAADLGAVQPADDHRIGWCVSSTVPV